MKDLYVFSGLGADERAFKRIDFAGNNVTYIRWHHPDKDTTLSEYAAGLAAQITSPEPVLIGLSFGGMLAVEVAKRMPVAKVILISSAKNYREVPRYFRLIGKLRLGRLIPGRIIKQPGAINYWLFGVETIYDKELIADILKDTNIGYFNWAIARIVDWDNERVIPGLVHIHGTSDRILPYRNIKADISIPGGGHMMILNKAEEISRVLQDVINSA